MSSPLGHHGLEVVQERLKQGQLIFTTASILTRFLSFYHSATCQHYPNTWCPTVEHQTCREMLHEGHPWREPRATCDCFPLKSYLIPPFQLSITAWQKPNWSNHKSDSLFLHFWLLQFQPTPTKKIYFQSGESSYNRFCYDLTEGKRNH